MWHVKRDIHPSIERMSGEVPPKGALRKDFVREKKGISMRRSMISTDGVPQRAQRQHVRSGHKF